MVQELTPPVASPRISAEEARMLYEDMVLGRLFEDKCAEMYYKGKMFGFVHLYNGQEAVSTGVIKALKPTDYICSTYRDHVHALSAGIPPRAVMAEPSARPLAAARVGAAPCLCFRQSTTFGGAMPLWPKGSLWLQGQRFRPSTAG
jgi:pyruvate dehydrogenase E1 component alpha subunit